MAFHWADLCGEGISCIPTEQGGTWFCKRNLSPISEQPIESARLERVGDKPNLTLSGGQAHFTVLADDGRPDLVVQN